MQTNERWYSILFVRVQSHTQNWKKYLFCSPFTKNDNFRQKIVVSFCSLPFSLFIFFFPQIVISEKRKGSFASQNIDYSDNLWYHFVQGNIEWVGRCLKKSLDFATQIVLFMKSFPKQKNDTTITKQLLRSAASIGANINEAVYGNSKADFIFKLHISR